MIFHSAFEYAYLWLPFIGFVVGFFGSLTERRGFHFHSLAPSCLGSRLMLHRQLLAATLPIYLAVPTVITKKNLDLRIGLIFAAGGFLARAWVQYPFSHGSAAYCFGIYSI